MVGTIFLAKSSHKYDVGNYLEIDPMYGTEIDFSNLCKKAKAKGIEGVVFDRGGFLFHGRVAALAEAAREAGLQF